MRNFLVLESSLEILMVILICMLVSKNTDLLFDSIFCWSTELFDSFSCHIGFIIKVLLIATLLDINVFWVSLRKLIVNLQLFAKLVFETNFRNMVISWLILHIVSWGQLWLIVALVTTIGKVLLVILSQYLVRRMMVHALNWLIKK